MFESLGNSVGWVTGYRGVPFKSRVTFRYELFHIIAWAVATGMLNPRFTALVALKSLDASDRVATVIGASVAFANLLAVFWGGWVRGRSKKMMLMIPAGMSVGVIASFCFTPLTPNPAIVFCLQVVLCYLCFSCVMTVRSAVWRVNYPSTHRAQIAARFNVWIMLLGQILTVFLAASYLDGAIEIGSADWRWVLADLSWLPGAGQPSAYGYVYPVATLFMVVAVALYGWVRVRDERNGVNVLAGVPTPPFNLVGNLAGVTAQIVSQSVAPVRAAWRVVRDDMSFRNYMIWQFIIGSATMMVEIPLVVILKERFGVNYVVGGTALVFVPSLTMLVAMPLWAKWFDRTNILRFRSRQMIFWGVSRVVLGLGVWLLSVPLVLVGVAIAGIGAGGGRLAWMLGHMQFANRQDDALYMGIHVSLTGLRGCIMPFVGMWLYRDVVGWHMIWLTTFVYAVSIVAFGKMADTWERRQREKVADEATS